MSKDSPHRLLLGNEAVARGAIEAGVQFVSGYPGTPSSEIVESLIDVAKDNGIYAEWSANEKVAFEGAYAAAIAGLRSLVAMKHVGLNVAADALMVAWESGVKGGMIVAVADDPGAPASQNEQDSRLYALHIPCFEPSSPQEAKDMVVRAFEISEELEQLILVRLTGGVSHAFEDVELGKITKRIWKAKFPHEEWPRFYLDAGWVICPLHKRAHEVLTRFRVEAERSPFNRLEIKGHERFGIIASGAAYNNAKEVSKILGVENEIAFLKIGISNPIPTKLVEHLLSAVDTVLVIEETEPFIEEQVRSIALDIEHRVKVIGRRTGHVPVSDCLSTQHLTNVVGVMVGKAQRVLSKREKLVERVLKDMPSRGLSLCPGCPHMGSLFAIRQVLRKMTGKRRLDQQGFIALADIGCYGIGGYPPHGFQETEFSMGGSISAAAGFAHANTGEIVVASIGDSTFFHAGIPALINAVWNQAKITVIVHDNAVTAMTGEQPAPNSGRTAMGAGPVINVEDIVKAIGVKYVRVVDPYDLKATMEAIEDAINYDGVSVVVCKRKCALVARRESAAKGAKRARVNQERCIGEDCGCGAFCIRIFSCAAIVWDSGLKKAKIDDTLCNGCGLCAQVCPAGAIVVEEVTA